MKKFSIILVLFLNFAYGLDKNDPYFSDTNSTCPIKFIDVFKSPNFVAVIEYKDNKKILFSSSKQMFHYFYKLNHHFVPINRLLVTDFKTGELIEASEAFYVFGSRIVSASGDDLIPFALEADAKEFASKNSGHAILPFSKITAKLIDYLN